MSSQKQLVVNADDFGFTPDVNEGIVEAHRYGILTATTLMANGAAFDDALRLARQYPSLDIGCHLVLIGGHSLLTQKPFPATVPGLVAALAGRAIRPYDELKAQVRRIVQAGVAPSHLDTHKHTHLAPGVLEAVARLSEEFDIRWVRRPFDFPLHGLAATALRRTVPRMKQLTSGALTLLRRHFHRVLLQHGCRTTDHFAGFQITGRFRAAELVALLALLPGGSTELMCHPGRCGPALRAARTRLKESREHELAALVAPEVRQALERNGIDLVDYRGLACPDRDQA
ncbi:MAG TPA: ChbG/HpnK family deacetylase [Candidatus Acidoferrales bacterium]|nr:ChbG/HpnK family deacetylase [Candidatus Acidoferrales bacterium]